MTNPYYTKTFDVTPGTTVGSQRIEDQYLLVEQGFDAVNVQMLLRGSIAGQVWTGAHDFTGATLTAATQAQGDNSTKVATTAYADTIKTYGTTTYAPLISPALTGTPTAPTAAIGTNTTQIATTAFVKQEYAPLASPALTGVPTAPTAAGGTATDQIATTSYVVSTAFNSALPGQTGNSGKFVTTNGSSASWADVYPSQTSNSGKFLQTNGTTTAWAFAGVSQVTTATTATTLTSTPTLLKITPASYGVTVTLPDATTCSVGGPLHIIDNRGAYPVRVCDSTGTLKGFIFAGVVSHISLDDNSTAAGVWAIENSELVGVSAILPSGFTLYRPLDTLPVSIDLGGGRELLLGYSSSTYPSCAVYDSNTNTFGSTTVIRAVTSSVLGFTAALVSTDKVLVTTCPATTALEAVVLTISGTTVTVNTAATATLSAAMNTVSESDLVSANGSFVFSYRTSTTTCELRAISVSGTTATIGSAVTLSGVDGAYRSSGGTVTAAPLYAIGSVVIAASYVNGTAVYYQPYTVSGSTLTLGTGASRAGLGCYVYKLLNPGSGRLIGLHRTSSSVFEGSVITLSGTSVALSNVTLFTTGNAIADAKVSGTNKVIVATETADINLLTDTSGTASAGSASSLFGANVYPTFLDSSGTTVYTVCDTATPSRKGFSGDCSGSSASYTTSIQFSLGAVSGTGFSSLSGRYSNSVGDLHRSFLKGNSGFLIDIQPVAAGTSVATMLSTTLKSGVFGTSIMFNLKLGFTDDTAGIYKGRSSAEKWLKAEITKIVKVECV